jgi:hypothetical protein
MADGQNHSFKPLPMANYSSAIARAVEWLGDRYLLAKPGGRRRAAGCSRSDTLGLRVV